MHYVCQSQVIWILIAAFVIIPTGNDAHGQEEGNGLETDSSGMYVLVERLTDDARDIGLRRTSIRNKVQLGLRKAGIKVSSKEYSPYLYVNVNVVGNSFNVGLEYKRITFYKVDNKFYRTRGITWNDAGTGIHNGSSEYIIDSLSSLLENFLNEYLEANG